MYIYTNTQTHTQFLFRQIEDLLNSRASWQTHMCPGLEVLRGTVNLSFKDLPAFVIHFRKRPMVHVRR